MPSQTLPKDGLVRALSPADMEIRADGEGTMPKLTGYMMRFDEWTEIDSIFEGQFLERVRPGAAKRSLEQNRSLRILFNHGHDPSVGEKPIADPRFIEDSQGVRYDEPELYDADYVRELVPALRAGQFGSSFKFRVVQEEINEEPERSEQNPDGIPERSITELKLYEGGPVVFPAYEGSSAGARSLTDHFFIDILKTDPSRSKELDELFVAWVARNPERCEELLIQSRQDGEGEEQEEAALPGPEAEPHSSRTRADQVPLYGANANKTPSWRL